MNQVVLSATCCPVLQKVSPFLVQEAVIAVNKDKCCISRYLIRRQLDPLQYRAVQCNATINPSCVSVLALGIADTTLITASGLLQATSRMLDTRTEAERAAQLQFADAAQWEYEDEYDDSYDDLAPFGNDGVAVVQFIFCPPPPPPSDTETVQHLQA